MDKQETIWSYCQACQTQHNFVLVDNRYVGEKCGKPLVKASNYGTIVTPRIMEVEYGTDMS